MGIFDRLRDRVFGHRKDTPGAPAGTPAPATPGAPAPTTPTGAAPAPTPAMTEVDVEAMLEAMAAKHPHQVNWRESIVDLMALVGIDNSLAERRELARELGYTGDMNDTAPMNIWLHKQVMRKLAEHGGKVPANLLD